MDWKEEDETVYVTGTGLVYHKDYHCTYLDLSIRMVQGKEISELRNESGGRYYACEHCGGKGGGPGAPCGRLRRADRPHLPRLPRQGGFKKAGAHVTSVVGFRNKDLVILEKEFKEVSDEYVPMSDDGTYGTKGLVTNALEKLINEGNVYDEVFAVGPLIMMKFVVLTCKKYNVPCTVSMNPLMIDGTGMCGCCRLTVGGKTKFACVDGPDFNGYEVDFDEAMSRNTMYREFERKAYDDACNLFKKEVK